MGQKPFSMVCLFCRYVKFNIFNCVDVVVCRVAQHSPAVMLNPFCFVFCADVAGGLGVSAAEAFFTCLQARSLSGW